MMLLVPAFRNYINFLRTKEIGTAERDALMLICHALNLKTTEFYLHQNKELSEDELRKIQELINRRALYEPVSKIIGQKLFFDSSFYVNASVLDPRPETEMLVSVVLKNIGRAKTLLDLGTGSGCVAISVALSATLVNVVGSDISAEALVVARQNAERNSVEVNFILSDWFNEIVEKYDVIVSNPPYVRDNDFFSLSEDVKGYDPKLALVGGVDGLNCYRKIALSLSSHLNKTGMGFFEIGAGQRNDVIQIFTAHGLLVSDVYKDLSGVDRVLCVKKDA